MGVEDYQNLISVTATISTIVQFMTGIPICRNIKRKGTTEGVSGVPFLAGVLGCVLWLRYGSILQDTTMILVNFIGLIFQMSYSVFYYLYTIPKRPFQKQVLIVFTIISVTMLYITTEINLDIAKFRLGLICCTTTILFCSAPLASLGEVMRTRCTESLPFHLILATVIVAGQWFLYGVAIHDPFVMIPNFIGCLIASFQLALFGFFPSTSYSKLIVSWDLFSYRLLSTISMVNKSGCLGNYGFRFIG